METLFGKKKNFYKANLHCHTTYSDGKRTPEEIKEAYLARGYSAVAFTDHEHLIDHSYLTDGEFVAITGAELAIKEFPEQSTGVNTKMKVTHLNIYAKSPENTMTPCYSSLQDHYVYDWTRHLVRHEGEFERIHSHEGINDIVSRAKKAGFLVAYNHPSWSLETAVDYLGYEGFNFVEIYNGGCVNAGHDNDEHVFSDMTRAGKKIFCTATDDNHNKFGFADSFGGWVVINADRLEYGELIAALERGDFYASSGPEIYSLVRDGSKVRIKTSPVEKINIITVGRKHRKLFADSGKTLTEAEFDVTEKDEIFRIKITDGRGCSAYTQYYPTVGTEE